MRRAVSGMTLMLLVASILALPPSRRLVGAQESAVAVRIVNPLTGDNKFIFNSTDHPVNSTFTVDFYVVNVTGMCGWQILIEWNNTVIHFKDVWITDDNVFAFARDRIGILIYPPPPFGLYVVNESDEIDSFQWGASVFPWTVDIPTQAILCKLNFTIAAAPEDSRIFTNIEMIKLAPDATFSTGSFVSVSIPGVGIRNRGIYAEPAIVGIFKTAIPEFQSAIILPLLMLLTIFALSFTWKRKARETQPH